MNEDKRQKLIIAAKSANGQLIIEYLAECLTELDCNRLHRGTEATTIGQQIKAILEAREFIKNRISFLEGEKVETDSILNYLK